MFNKIESPAHYKILNREESKKLVNENYLKEINILKDIVNYGTNLIPRCFISSQQRMQDVVIVSLLKNAIAMLDSVHILLSNGAVYSAQVPARSLFETSLIIEWIFKKDTILKTKYYYVWTIRKMYIILKKIVPGTPEQKRFKDKIKDFDPIFHKVYDDLGIHSKVGLVEAEKILNSSTYRHINEEFEKRRRNKDYDIIWYKPLGIRSIFKLAKDLNRTAEYELIYDQLSQPIHGTALFQNIDLKIDKVIFINIRNLEEFEMIVKIVCRYILDIYKSVLEFYRPDEVKTFSNKVISNWYF